MVSRLKEFNRDLQIFKRLVRSYCAPSQNESTFLSLFLGLTITQAVDLYLMKCANIKYVTSLLFIIVVSTPPCLGTVVPARDINYRTDGVSDKHEAIPYSTRQESLRSSHHRKYDTLSIRKASPSKPPKPGLTDEEVKEMLKDLGYDPNGDGEHLHALKNPHEIPKVAGIRDDAFRREDKEYPGPGMGHNDEADAFRHAFFNAKLASEIGAENAKGWADAHEVSGDNPVGETLMDLHNNQVGRDIGESLNNPTDDEIAGAVRQAIEDGELLTEPVQVQNSNFTNEDQSYSD